MCTCTFIHLIPPLTSWDQYSIFVLFCLIYYIGRILVRTFSDLQMQSAVTTETERNGFRDIWQTFEWFDISCYTQFSMNLNIIEANPCVTGQIHRFSRMCGSFILHSNVLNIIAQVLLLALVWVFSVLQYSFHYN